MDLQSLYLRGQHALQLPLCLYGAIACFRAIVRLQKYESMSVKLAGWSKEAGRQLQLTRTTQAAGAMAVLFSTIASALLTFYYFSLQKWLRLSLSPVALVIVLAARRHMQNYWAPRDGKTAAMKIPLPNMKEYSEATLHTQDILKILEYLEYSWVAASVVNALIK